MNNRDILAIGTSAGGFEALRFLAGKFPADLPASVLVVIHLSNEFRSSLDTILSDSGLLPAKFAEDGETFRRGHMYLAPPGRHLLVEADKLRLGEGPRENNARPAIDPLFRSAAQCCAGRTVGAVLTGTLGDGASGLWALQQAGGIGVVQDPDDAAFPEMPATAVRLAKPDHIVGLHDMPALFDRLVREPMGSPAQVPAEIKYEVELSKGAQGSMRNMDRLGRRSVLTCPDCNGTMWEIEEGELVRYRCHVGHAYTGDAMSVALNGNLRRALGSALRAVEERSALVERLGKQASDSGHAKLAQTWARKADEFKDEEDLLRKSVRRLERLAGGEKRD